jgi:hypothetical protein
MADGRKQPLAASVTVVSTHAGLQLSNVVTDAQGAFAIEAPPGPSSIVARADGYASEQQDVVVRPGRANTEVHFSLPAAASVSGHVVDQSGTGVAGARVWVEYRGNGRAWRLAEETGGEPADGQGRFVIPVVAQGRPFVLHAEKEGWLMSSSQTIVVQMPELRGVLLLLSRRGARVAGRVLDSGGRPVSGAQVHLRALPADNEFTADQRASVPFARSTNRTVVSQQDGWYEFDAVPPGRVVVTARQQNLRSAAETEAVSGRQSRLDIALR